MKSKHWDADWPWNFRWTVADVDVFKELARKGWSVESLARRFDTSEEEIVAFALRNRVHVALS